MEKAKPVKGKVVNYQVDKYLTDMKELPPEGKPEEKKDKTDTVKVKPEITPAAEIKAPKTDAKVAVKEETLPETPDSIKEKAVKAKKDDDKFKLDQETPNIISLKDIILGIINLISIIGIIFLLTKLPVKARELQAQRVEDIQNQINPKSEYGNIDADSEKANKLSALFLDQSGIVNFVSDVEKLKKDEPAISKVTFASPKPVKDQMGLYGLPVIIELRGNWNTISPAMEKIQMLPYLFRAVSIETSPEKEDSNVIIVKYGGFLYVNDKEVAK